MADKDKKFYHSKGSNGAVYCLGFIGALVFYIQQADKADSFWMGVLGVLKALVWPAFVVYDLLKFLHG